MFLYLVSKNKTLGAETRANTCFRMIIQSLSTKIFQVLLKIVI